ncbi:MAG: UDP-N-acetylglucosamine 2-epimerase (hydrolyzing) [Rhodospirillales bacterium]|nr:UDP-N-acetylglucosamine 2-epimerase (hydrolyzing) [Rhodospirillales bacterium]
MTRKVCVTTGSRAEYGHMQWLIRDIADDPDLELQIMLTGMHLEERFGNTYKEVEADGFAIDARVPMGETDDSPEGIAAAMGRGVAGMAKALMDLQPDILVILGDRFEMLAAASAAMVTQTPIAHLHGGEATEGLIDEAIRHSITKMAHLHFAAAKPYAQRIIQLGEDPARVFTVGTPGLDAIFRRDLMDKAELENSLGFDLGDHFFMLTYHPVTLSVVDPAQAMNKLFGALDTFPDHKVIITGVNADAGNDRIREAIAAYSDANPNRVLNKTSLGHHRYLSALTLADAVIGNSSSGIAEAPTAGTPTVNLGDRQLRRLSADSIIHCAEQIDDIRAAIKRALDPGFLETAFINEPPYGRGGASTIIKDLLKKADLSNILMKRFHNIPVPT